MNDDRKTPVSTWPPPGHNEERGNSDQTVVAPIPKDLLKRMMDSGSAAIDEPDEDVRS
jgi:hypothetical protein